MDNLNVLGTRLRETLHIQRALRLVWDSGPGWTIANLIIIVGQSILPLVSLYLTKLMVDAISAAVSAPPETRSFEPIVALVVLVGLAAIIDSVLSSVASLISEAQTQSVSDRVSAIIHAKSIEVDLEYYENPQFYDTLHRAQSDSPYRPPQIVNNLLTLIRTSFSLLGMVGLLISLHWAVAIGLFATTLPLMVVRLRFARVRFRWARQKSSAERQSQYFHYILTGQDYAKEIRLFNLGDMFAARFDAVRDLLRKEQLEITVRRSTWELFVQIGTTAALFGVYAFVANQALVGLITIGSLVMYFQAAQRAQALLREVLGSLASLYEHNLFLATLYQFLALEPKIARPLARPASIPRPMREGIRFENVGFTYPSSDKKVLENINLTIRPGEVIALVGANGAGKTTLIKLLCRLYDPTEGRITLDGVDLRDYDVAALRREISVVFQDYVQYFLSARENVWLGNIEASLETDERVIEAAKDAEAHEMFSGLKQGYDTLLGNQFENGQELSIGQWQRVALARAFMRDAQLVVLDEPTSALDVMSEHEVFERFRRIIAGRAAILISHRLSTVRMAHRIYVLEGRHMVESGTHEELMQLDGVYAGLFRTQSQHYQ
ncbi:MAG: ABC transporter ATP-binding protein [Burkholderiales bacterium]|nr:ABC transporter ATP-binding protein [Anaerolineae bacterium]